MDRCSVPTVLIMFCGGSSSRLPRQLAYLANERCCSLAPASPCFQTVCVINRSEVVGRPLAAMLSNDGAKVYSCDVDNIRMFTRGEGIKLKAHAVQDTDVSLEEAVSAADVVITGVPSKAYKLPTKYVKEGAVCVNFASHKNFEDDIEDKASIYVGNVGKVTVTMLMNNLFTLASHQRKMAAAQAN